MDHRESTESPSDTQRKMIEKRMEMIALLLNSRLEEEDKRLEAKKKLVNYNIKKFSGSCRGKSGKLMRWVSMINRMFL